MRRLKTELISFAAAGLIASPAFANYTCTGPIRGVALDVTSGDLLVESVGALSWPRLCSINSTVG